MLSLDSVTVAPDPLPRSSALRTCGRIRRDFETNHLPGFHDSCRARDLVGGIVEIQIVCADLSRYRK